MNHLLTKPTKWHLRPADSDLPGHLPADAQADQNLRWAHMPFCWFCHEVARMFSWKKHLTWGYGSGHLSDTAT